MDKGRIAALAACGERIKANNAGYLWICCGVKPPPLPDKPVATDPNVALDRAGKELGGSKPAYRRGRSAR